MAERVDEMTGLELEDMNTRVGLFEAMALAMDENHYVTTFNSTMAWQAAAGGVQNLFVLPPDSVDDWAETAPIITSGLGETFQGKLFPAQREHLSSAGMPLRRSLTWR